MSELGIALYVGEVNVSNDLPRRSIVGTLSSERFGLAFNAQRYASFWAGFFAGGDASDDDCFFIPWSGLLYCEVSLVRFRPAYQNKISRYMAELRYDDAEAEVEYNLYFF